MKNWQSRHTIRDRVQVRAFQTYFKIYLEDHTPIEAFACAIAKTSDMAYNKLTPSQKRQAKACIEGVA